VRPAVRHSASNCARRSSVVFMARDCSRSYPPTLSSHERIDMATATPRLMGAEVKRKEDPRLVTGASAYVGDVTVPGLHYVAFVRSPHAHARVRKIDAKAALKRPGVVRVVTGEDLRAHVQQIPLGGPSAEGGGGAKTEAGRKHFPLSIGRVRHVGEPVAAVIATSEAAAVDGAQDVVVDWDPLPAVGDLASAMAKSAPKLHDDAPGNVEHTTEIKQGDPDAAFKKAHRVVKQRMISQRLAGIPMEPRATLAAPDPATGGVTVWASHQAPHVLRNDLASVLGVPQNLVRVIAPEVGGGFGVKFGLYSEDATLAACARLYKLPLRWTETRVEHMVATTHGRAQVTELEAAVEADGTITAVRMHVTADIGAYPVFTFIPDLTLMMGVGVYKFTSVDLKSTCVFTNSTPVAAYRGEGRPEADYYLERLVDVVAQELGKKPEEIRRKNFIPPSAFPYTTPTGQRYDSGEYDRALTKAQDKERKIAATMLEAAAADVVYTEGTYHVKGMPAKALTIADIAAKAYAEGLPEGMEHGLEATEFFRPPQLVYPFGAHVAVVEIDRETGRVSVRDFISVDDCGVRISPMLVAGQVHGGIAQGIAQALLEEVVYSADGQLVTGSLMDYAIPHPEDLPSFKTDQTVTPTPFNPMGAKG